MLFEADGSTVVARARGLAIVNFWDLIQSKIGVTPNHHGNKNRSVQDIHPTRYARNGSNRISNARCVEKSVKARNMEPICFSQVPGISVTKPIWSNCER